MFLRDLLKRADEFDLTKVQPITDKVGEDTVVGEMTPELIRLYGVIYREGVALAELRKSLNARAEELGKNITDAHREQFNAEYSMARERFAALQKLLWVEIREAFPALGGHGLTAIREGFNIVIVNDGDCNCPACMTARILGLK